jgi:Protein of unknown function (DUF3089)
VGRVAISSRRRRSFVRAAVVVVAASAVACSSPAATPGNSGRVDASGVVWLCRPGLADNPCAADLTATAVGPGGSKAIQTPQPAADPLIDCFYVYPTVSTQPTMNANLAVDPAISRAARAQAAPFAPVCRVYAPMYRQLTHAAVNDLWKVTTDQAKTAYSDIVAAFEDYLANYNQSHGFVLIGHSQGAWVLDALIANEIDQKPARRALLVSAILVGGNVAGPAIGADGGDYANIAACTSPGQIGCVVAYSTFTEEPPSDSWFGRIVNRYNPFIDRTNTSGKQVICVNPANVGGGTGVLEPHILTEELMFQGITSQSGITTPWVTYPQEYAAHCESSEGAVWLQVDVLSGANETRPVIPEANGLAYGLHNVDIAIALGNLVELVRLQEAGFQS